MPGASVIGELIEVNVVGAPLRLGQHVVIKPTDDESADQRFFYRRGVVRGLLYDAREQWPHAPLVSVRVDGLGDDLFFVHELALSETGRL